MTRSETFRGPRRSSRGSRQAAGPSKVRLRLEWLEDRLPPGDAFLTGLLATPTTGPVSAVQAVPPGPARRLAADVGLAEADTFASLAGSADARPILVNPFASTHAEVPSTERDDPFPLGPRARRAPTSMIPDAGPVPVGSVSAGAVGADSASVSTNVFVAIPPANYQLDQAAAAIVTLGPEPDDLEPADLDTGAGVQSSGVHARFDLGHPTTGPFPSNVFTVPDRTQNTGRRVDMPFPDCKVYVSDCEDLAVINELDGFNLQPRLSVPFSAPIDVNSVSSSTVFLVSLGSTVPGQGYMPRGTVVGINQIVWDVETNALHVESDELLAQHTRFALIVTNGIRDADGDRVEASREFRRFRQTALREYRRELLDAIQVARRLGVRERDIVTTSVFTTQSATAVMEKIRDQIHAETPEPADFLLGPKGERAVFSLDGVTGIRFDQQTLVEGPLNPVNLDLPLIRDTVGGLAFGKYVSPDYMVHPGEYIPPVGTRTGTPAVQGVNEIYFNLFLPSGPAPAGGWPVAMFGPGNTNNKNNQPLAVAASMAAHGIATIAINAVGHGFGPLGTLTVSHTVSGPVTFSAGGRGIDQDGDGMIADNEGVSAAPPRGIVFFSDGMRQTAVDLMQLVQVIEVGMDVDGDGQHDLDPSRIYYSGQSFGSNFGTVFLAVEPSVQAGTLSAPGNPPANRQLGGRGLGVLLSSRQPSLLNSPGITVFGGRAVNPPHYHENLPLRDGISVTVRLADGTTQVIQSPVTNNVPGAMAIQQIIENTEWISQAGSPVAYAPHLRKAPLPGVPAKSVIYQFAKGDMGAPNPNTTAILRAGDLADRTLYYRHDLARAEIPSLPRNPHQFMVSTDIAAFREIALGAQAQIGIFLASDGKAVIHPEPERFFEVPIKGPLPEDLNYLP